MLTSKFSDVSSFQRTDPWCHILEIQQDKNKANSVFQKVHLFQSLSNTDLQNLTNILAAPTKQIN